MFNCISLKWFEIEHDLQWITELNWQNHLTKFNILFNIQENQAKWCSWWRCKFWIFKAIFSIIYFFPNRTSIVHKNANIFTTVSKYGALLFFYLHFVLISFQKWIPKSLKYLFENGMFWAIYWVLSDEWTHRVTTDMVGAKTRRTDNVPIQTKLIRNIENH